MECPICLDPLKNKTKIITKCNHTFCIECFFNLYEPVCPLCRKNLKDSLTSKPLAVILKNNKNEKPKSTVNIYNDIDFPPLG